MTLPDALLLLAKRIERGEVTFEAIEGFLLDRMPQGGVATDRDCDSDVENAINKVDYALSVYQSAMKNVGGKLKPSGRTLARRRGIREKMLALCAAGRISPDHIDSLAAKR